MSGAILSSTIDDTQTVITSLGAAIAGSASESLSNLVIRKAGINGQSFGDSGFRFVVRAMISSVCFSAIANVMPESSSNIFFSIVYFAANRSVVTDAVAVGNSVVRAVGLGLPTLGVLSNPPNPRDATKSDCGKCN